VTIGPIGESIVLIAYHFPPDPAVGSLRAAKVARAFRDAGYSVDVVTARLPGETGMRATSSPALRVHTVQSLPDLHEILRVLKTWLTKARRRQQAERTTTAVSWSPPARLPLWRRFLFSLLWLPDDRQGFIVPAWGKARSLLRQGAGLVYSTAPPFSPHLVGLTLRWTTRAPWVMELRDPWADNTQKPWFIRTNVTDAFDARIERYCVERADLVVTVSEGIRARLLARLPGLDRSRLIVIRNGIERLAQLTPLPGRAGPVRVAYVGTFYYGRDPRPFLHGLAAVCQKRGWGADQVQVDFAGACRSVGTVSVEDEVQDLGLSQVVNFHDWLPHAVAQRLVEDADVLLLLAQQQPDQVPNKLYEYLGARRTILAFADAGGETATMLTSVGGHHVITNDNPTEVEQVLEELILAARSADRLLFASKTDEGMLEEWTTEAQMKHLMTAVRAC
jgi:glycosyltransferase involved in cell wall biosynthesis